MNADSERSEIFEKQLQKESSKYFRMSAVFWSCGAATMVFQVLQQIACEI
jgi:hypothetical protein